MYLEDNRPPTLLEKVVAYVFGAILFGMPILCVINWIRNHWK